MPKTWMDRHHGGEVATWWGHHVEGGGHKCLGPCVAPTSVGHPPIARGGGGKNMDRVVHDERNVAGEAAKNTKGCRENCCIGKPSGRCGNEVKGATINPSEYMP